jgi:hypothetical protein
MKFQYTAIACIALLALAFSACEDDDSNESATNSYLPLKIGNYWEFVNTPEYSSIIYTQRTEVTRIVSINNNEYFELVTQHKPGQHLYIDTIYYRITNEGYVYTLTRDWTMEENPMRLFANDGDTWRYATNYHAEAMISVDEMDDLEVGDEKFDDCKSFSYDVEQMADEEYSTVLAPGIGFVKRISGWGLSSELVKASINGKEYTF